MNSINLLNKIEALPPLPKTIIDIEEFRKKIDKESSELLNIVEKDALIVSNLLKISNSAMFGFRSKVETPGRSINLLGINFTISIAIGGTIQNLLMTNLDPYQSNSDDFMKASNLSSTLTNLWVSKIDYNLKDELLLPALLQDAGKFILSDIIISQNLSDQFKQKISEGHDFSTIEKELLNFTTSEITAKIFRHWKLSDNLINIIEFVDNLDKCPEELKQKAQILNVIKTICSINQPFSQNNIEKGLNKAKEFNLPIKPLEKAIETLEDRLLDE